MKNFKIEEKLAWWNEVSAGIGLILGYILYSLFWLLTPETIVHVDVSKPVEKLVEIGKIPNDFHDSQQINDQVFNHIKIDFENLPLEKSVYKLAPVLSKEGIPEIEVSEQVYTGKGKSSVISTKQEILVPVLAEPKFTYLIFKSKNEIHFYPNVIYKGTGTYYERKEVRFEDPLSADSFAIRTATFFAFISFLLFCFKIRKKVGMWAKNILKAKFDSYDEE